MKIFSYIVSLFGENKCFGCQKSGHFFCPQCSDNIEIYSPYCYFCKKTSDDFAVHDECKKRFPLEAVIVMTRYRKSAVKRLIRHAKYYGKYVAYRDILSPNKDFFTRYINAKNSILIPVPMHFLRRWKRGYNQSDIIAQNLGEICQIPVKNTFLSRSRYTKQQSHLSASERAKNLTGVFGLKSSELVDKNCTIYLVDDVISTGSTLLEIAKLLHENGYKNIKAIVIASD